MLISHRQQKLAWQKEHKNPKVFTGLATQHVSGGVKVFWEYFKNKHNNLEHITGLEMSCGKGRNVIWLAKQGVKMEGFDFSSAAISTAKRRTKKDIINKIRFTKHDATKSWLFNKNSFDFIIDCFGSTDIDGIKNRKFVNKEIWRVLKPGGYFFIYTNSIKSEIYIKMSNLYSIENEPNAFYYPSINKFEKVFKKEELDILYHNFKLKKSKTYRRKSKVNSKTYVWEHFWRIYQKPL